MPANIFKRIHRSYIVNLDEINAVVGNMVEVTEKGQSKNLPIGKNYKDELLEIVNKNRAYAKQATGEKYLVNPHK